MFYIILQSLKLLRAYMFSCIPITTEATSLAYDYYQFNSRILLPSHAFKTTDNDFKYTRIWGYRHVQPGTVRFVIQSNDLEDKNKT